MLRAIHSLNAVSLVTQPGTPRAFPPSCQAPSNKTPVPFHSSSRARLIAPCLRTRKADCPRIAEQSIRHTLSSNAIHSVCPRLLSRCSPGPVLSRPVYHGSSIPITARRFIPRPRSFICNSQSPQPWKLSSPHNLEPFVTKPDLA